MHFFVRPMLFTAPVFVLLMKIAKIFAVFFFLLLLLSRSMFQKIINNAYEYSLNAILYICVSVGGIIQHITIICY